jgi:hypothetical protein
MPKKTEKKSLKNIPMAQWIGLIVLFIALFLFLGAASFIIIVGIILFLLWRYGQ